MVKSTSKPTRKLNVSAIKESARKIKDAPTLDVIISDIRVDEQDRKNVVNTVDEEFVNSIKLTDGNHTPILITNDPTNEQKYLLIAGERRLIAMQMLKRKTINAVIINGEQASLIQLSENSARRALTLVEFANAAQTRLDLGMSLEEIATAAAVTVATVKQRLTVLNYEPEILEIINDGLVANLGVASKLNVFCRKHPKEIANIRARLTDGDSISHVLASMERINREHDAGLEPAPKQTSLDDTPPYYDDNIDDKPRSGNNKVDVPEHKQMPTLVTSNQPTSNTVYSVPEPVLIKLLSAYTHQKVQSANIPTLLENISYEE